MQKENKNKLLLITGGILAGFINGFLGGGGGVVTVALMLTLLCLPQQKAQATALTVILPLTVVSAVVYLIGGTVDWAVTLPVTIGVCVGGVVGALLLSKLNGKATKIIFALVLIAGGIKMLF